MVCLASDSTQESRNHTKCFTQKGFSTRSWVHGCKQGHGSCGQGINQDLQGNTLSNCTQEFGQLSKHPGSNCIPASWNARLASAGKYKISHFLSSIAASSSCKVFKQLLCFTNWMPLAIRGLLGLHSSAVTSLPWLILVQIAGGSRSVSSRSLEGKSGFCKNALCFSMHMVLVGVGAWWWW